MEHARNDPLRRDIEALNKRIYAELFLTPDFDVWLGLVPDDTYTALEKEGCACDPERPDDVQEPVRCLLPSLDPIFSALAVPPPPFC